MRIDTYTHMYTAFPHMHTHVHTYTCLHNSHTYTHRTYSLGHACLLVFDPVHCTHIEWPRRGSLSSSLAPSWTWKVGAFLVVYKRTCWFFPSFKRLPSEVQMIPFHSQMLTSSIRLQDLNHFHRGAPEMQPLLARPNSESDIIPSCVNQLPTAVPEYMK